LGGNANVATVNVVPGLSPVDITGTQSQEERQEEPREEPREEMNATSDERLSEPSGDVDEQVASEGNEESAESGQDGNGSTADGGRRRNQPSQQDRANSRREKVKELMVAKAKELANDVANATSLEQQRAIQSQLLAAIGFNPDFTAYKVELQDTPFYEDPGLADAKLPSARTALRNGLAQQILHEEMVDMQYEGMK